MSTDSCTVTRNVIEMEGYQLRNRNKQRNTKPFPHTSARDEHPKSLATTTLLRKVVRGASLAQ